MGATLDFVRGVLGMFAFGAAAMLGVCFAVGVADVVSRMLGRRGDQPGKSIEPRVTSTPIGTLFVFGDGTTFYTNNGGETFRLLDPKAPVVVPDLASYPDPTRG